MPYVCTKQNSTIIVVATLLQCLHHHLSNIFHIQRFQIGKWTFHAYQFQHWRILLSLDAYDEIPLARFIFIYLNLGGAALCG